MKRTIIAAIAAMALSGPAIAGGMNDLMFYDSVAYEEPTDLNLQKAKMYAAQAGSALDKAEEASRRDAKWADFISDLAKVSMTQSRDGKPKIKRECYPSEGTCSEFLAAIIIGQPTVAEQSIDLDGVLVMRRICKMTPQRDAMTCTDFDSGVKSNSMIVEGEWRASK